MKVLIDKLSMIEQIKNIINKIILIRDEFGLEKVPKISFSLKIEGEDIIYFSKGTWNDKEKYLIPAPTKKRKNFF